MTLVGRRILVDVQEFDASLRHRRTMNYSGVIVEEREGLLCVRRDDTGGVVELAASSDDLEDAEPGQYWLRTTGEAVPQPDLLAEWTHIDAISAEPE